MGRQSSNDQKILRECNHSLREKHMRAGSTSFHPYSFNPYHLTPIYSPLYLLTPLSFNPSIILSRHLSVDIKGKFWHN